MGTPTQIFIPFFSRATNHHIHPPFLQEWISYLFTWFESNSEPIPVEHSLKLSFSPQFHHRCYSDVRHPGLSVECFSHSSKDVPDRAAPSAGEVRGQPLRFTLCDGEKKNGQGVNLREEERNPWNLSQEVFDKKKRLWWVSILLETQQTISCFLALSFLCQLYISRYYQQKHGIVFMTRIFLFFEDGPAFNILSPISRNASLDKD